jgi:TRAP-type C4-dicarboxylate transport system permease small subunit
MKIFLNFLLLPVACVLLFIILICVFWGGIRLVFTESPAYAAKEMWAFLKEGV